MNDSIDPRERAWTATVRWTELRGEMLANVIRLAGAGGFYLLHVLNYFVWSDPVARDAVFHRRATLIAMVAVALGAVVMLLLRKQFFPAWLKYATTGVDLLLITFLAAFGNKLGSPIVYAYFALVGVAAIRMRPSLVACTAVGGAAGMFVLYTLQNVDLAGAASPPYRAIDLAAMTLSIALLGVAAGQTVRQAKRICREYAARVDRIEQLSKSSDGAERTSNAAPEGEGGA
jgi:hypothetical protein